MSYQVFSATLGSALAIAILFLVRRDHLQLGHALYWIAFAAASLLFGLLPGFSDRLAALLGISYGPTLVILIAVAALVLRSLQADIQSTRLERSVRRLTQRIALLDAQLSERHGGNSGESEASRNAEAESAAANLNASPSRRTQAQPEN